MIQNGDAFIYYEPNGLVVSRSGDECVVTYADQWYIKYGEEKWQQDVVKYVNESMNTYNDATKTSLLGALDWLKEWAISRQYGLGTRVCPRRRSSFLDPLGYPIRHRVPLR